jgi:hypothetical protein
MKPVRNGTVNGLLERRRSAGGDRRRSVAGIEIMMIGPRRPGGISSGKLVGETEQVSLASGELTFASFQLSGRGTRVGRGLVVGPGPGELNHAVMVTRPST